MVQPTKRIGNPFGSREDLDWSQRSVGAWVPWPAVESIVQMQLKPASTWQVFTAIYMTVFRYGGKRAFLGTREIASLTGLSTRTVKRAVSTLLKRDLVRRAKRYRGLALGTAVGIHHEPTCHNRERASQSIPDRDARGATKLALPRGQPGGTSPNVFNVSSLNNNSERAFSQKQLRAVASARDEASQLLGRDAWQLHLPAASAKELGFQADVTYAEAFAAISGGHQQQLASRFVRATLLLREDPRVQGDELKLIR